MDEIPGEAPSCSGNARPEPEAELADGELVPDGGQDPLEAPPRDEPTEADDERIMSFPRSSGQPSRMREAVDVKEEHVQSFPRSAGVPSRMREAPALPEGDSGDELFAPIEGSTVGPEVGRSSKQESRSGLYRAVELYSRQVEKRPWMIILISTVLVIAIVAPLFRIPTIEFDFSTFIRADGDSMLRREAYILALGEREGPNARRRLSALPETGELRPGELLQVGDEEVEVMELVAERNASSRRLFNLLIYTKGLTLIYDAKANIMNKKVLQQIANVEVSMRNLEGYKRLCDSTASILRGYCDPGESLMAYAWATQVPPTSTDNAAARFIMQLDGNSHEPIPPPAFLAYIAQGGHPILDFRRFFPNSYVPPERNDTGHEAAGELPEALRSRFFFAFDVTGSSQGAIQAAVEQAKRDWETFVAQELYPFLKGQGSFVRYAGDFITSLELVDTLQSDLSFAVGSVAFVLLCLWFQLQAIWMSFCCLFMILLSLPIAFVLTPAEKLTVTSFLALFLIVGIGSDTVFVYVDIWTQEAKRPMEQRIPITLVSAGVNCLATSLTTAASFLANLASVLQPLREFGFFMGLCCLWCFVLISLYLPPMLVIQARNTVVEPEDAAASTAQSYAGVLPALPAPEGSPPPKKKKSKKGRCARLARSYLRALARKTAFCPGVILVVAALFVILMGVGISLDISLASGVPQVFPDGHNQVVYPVLEAEFSPIPRVDISISSPTSKETVCEANAPWASSMFSACSLYWCDQDVVPLPNADECWSTGVQSSSGAGLSDCASISLNARVAAINRPTGPTADTALRAMAQALAGARYSSSMALSVALSTAELSTLIMESWSEGSVVASRFYRLGSATVVLSPEANATEVCTAQVVCNWEVPHCSFQDYTPLGNFSPSTRRLDEVRQLQSVPTVAANKQIDVTVLWGIRAPRTIPLLGPNADRWSFDPTFQMSNPWAQRALVAMCEDTAPAELRILRKRCWIDDLRNKLRWDNKRFPSRNFYPEVIYYAVSNLPMQEQLWIVNDEVVAASLNFYCDFAFDAGAQAVLDFKAKWDAHVDALNAVASTTGNMAWHTAQAWVSAEAEVAIINSTILTIVVAALGGFACMIIFTADPLLALMVLLLVLGVITGLAFFMVVVMGWALGPIEVISLVVFVGYSVTYSLHVAHIYGEVDDQEPAEDRLCEAVVQSEDRKAPPSTPPALEVSNPEVVEATAQESRMVRARKAVLRIGISTLSSTLSTAGASAFLLLATMQIFTKLGLVVLVVSVLSCLASLVVLPASLIICGPSNRTWRERCCGRPKVTSEKERDGRGNG